MLELSGQQLSLAEIALVAQGEEAVVLSNTARAAMEASRRIIEQIIESEQVVYGVNTGFGKLADVRVPPRELQELQLNLVRSHACGLGSRLSAEETRAMLLLRANVLAKGHSGARPLLADTLLLMLNCGVLPIIPEKGSVGASGDLAPLAHLALTVIGEGEVIYQGERMSSSEALRRTEIEALTLQAKEGLALLNGTQAMAAVGGLALHRARRVALVADVAGAMTLEGLRGTPTAFDERNMPRDRTEDKWKWPRTSARSLLIAKYELHTSRMILVCRTLTPCVVCPRCMAQCETLWHMPLK
jgi:histidine ammonia-lyase